MIIFPLITAWMWLQIITASPLPFSGRRYHLCESSKSAPRDLPGME